MPDADSYLGGGAKSNIFVTIDDNNNDLNRYFALSKR